ncbi:T9SS type A sorting domain-containing protein [uncultured Winogradskyella sp.]|uniref:T9SS type A sorting domain-containing protein n=1 Tax=uncultured Winogradskyella sp. TaxID=395353 RepID=UPI00260BA0EC|nr:T9SS type A sorting domain-containing protein [uncultured Winogradskyella sp.]
MKKTLLTILIFAGFSNLNFSQAWILSNVDPNTGNEPYEIASGDIDGDGDMDLVMATYDYNGGTPLQDYIKCYLNDGNGNFPVEIIVSSTIRWVDGLTLADVNEDGAFDIVASSAIQNKLVYYLSSTSMDNTYVYTEVSIASNIASPGDVVAGDINGDNHIDIVVPSYGSNWTQWFSGDGMGNFFVETTIESATTDGPYHIDVADFDADGDLDVVVGFVNSQSVEIYYNQYDGSDPTSVSWVKDTQTVDSGNSFLLVVAFADVNNDGIMDVVKLDNSSGEVEWFNKIKNGASTANTISDETIIDRPGAILVTDIDEDGLNDVILTDGGSADDAIVWFKGAANASPSATPTLIVDNNHQMFHVTAADFDGDLDIDIAAIGNSSDTVDWMENRINLLSVNDFESNTISIYPNPAKDVLNISGYSDTSIEISIVDLLGKKVLEKTLYTNEALDVSQLSNGIYTIKINNGFTYKFIKG